MFKTINTLEDLQPFVADKNEIRFYKQGNGVTMSMYLFMDSKTFDSPEAIECRGTAFDEEGRVVSRPLHKFFNVGEKEHLSPANLLKRSDEVVGVYEKLDGSMVATAWVHGDLAWRSKKTFSSEIVKLTEKFLAEDAEGKRIEEFAYWCAFHGMTAIFELTHPEAQIVVPQDRAQLRLLHVRDNVTGEYVLLNPDHPVQNIVREIPIPRVVSLNMTLEDVFTAIPNMEMAEGYVVQFKNGDMVKIKCPWYSTIHRGVTFMRERDIATLALNETLDDVKSHMALVGINLAKVNEVEQRLKEKLLAIEDEINAVYEAGKELERKDFATKNKSHPLFGLIMSRYTGADVDLKAWYAKNRLKDEFSLKSLLEGAAAEAAEG